MSFLSNRRNDAEVMDKGVWRYSRHPNCFGEFVLWWGIWLLAASGGLWWTVVSPLLLSFFLLKVSGAAMLEKAGVDDVVNAGPVHLVGGIVSALAVAAVNAGWAIPHPWTDKRHGWDGFVMIYTPLTQDHLDVVKQLLEGSYQYVTGQPATN